MPIDRRRCLPAAARPRMRAFLPGQRRMVLHLGAGGKQQLQVAFPARGIVAGAPVAGGRIVQDVLNPAPQTARGLRLRNPNRLQDPHDRAGIHPGHRQRAQCRVGIGRQVLRHWSPCFALRQPGAWRAMNISATSLNVLPRSAARSVRRSVSGSFPLVSISCRLRAGFRQRHVAERTEPHLNAPAWRRYTKQPALAAGAADLEVKVAAIRVCLPLPLAPRSTGLSVRPLHLNRSRADHEVLESVEWALPGIHRRRGWEPAPRRAFITTSSP